MVLRIRYAFEQELLVFTDLLVENQSGRNQKEYEYRLNPAMIEIINNILDFSIEFGRN
jgi:hypothetical protein